MDIFVEPFYPKPELIVYGNTPIANELIKFAEKFSFNFVQFKDLEENKN